ncbi:hypothetical protein CDL15_Pgr022161 [Punica granatum]|nr:hypothetical protein CDL15_Pgr022161 [Punica granatum]
MGIGDLRGGVGGSSPRIDRGLRVGVPDQFVAGAANWLPQPLYRGRRRFLWVPITSVEGLRDSIGGLNQQIDRELRLGVPGKFEGWGHQSAILTPPPRWPIPRTMPVTSVEESGSPISGLSHELIENSNSEAPINSGAGAAYPSSEVTGTHRGRRQLATPTPPSLSIFFLGLK